MLQQTPCPVTTVAPSEVTTPPANALVELMPLTAAVTTTGSTPVVLHPARNRINSDIVKLKNLVLLVRVINIKSILGKVVCIITKTKFRIGLFFRRTYISIKMC